MPDSSRSPIHTEGGKVQAGRGIYIVRRADAELYDHCMQGRLSYILHTRQVGKSSLISSVAGALTRRGVRVALIDLTMLGTATTAEQWYLGILDELHEQLELDTDVFSWWDENARLGLTHRLRRFFADVILQEVPERVVVFLDEIDTTIPLDFTDDFFAAIRELYQARHDTPALKRLSFVIAGTASANDLMKDPDRTPFNVGERISLEDFTLAEALPLAQNFIGANGEQEIRYLLSKVLDWTGGHPYLTQVVCAAITRAGSSVNSLRHVDEIVRRIFLSADGDKERNLSFVSHMLTDGAKHVGREELLHLLRRISRGHAVRDRGSKLISHLKLSGVVRVVGEHLQFRNEIYKHVFNQAWIDRQVGFDWWYFARRVTRQALPSTLAAAVTLAVATTSFVLLERRFAMKDAALEQKLALLRAGLDEDERVRRFVVERGLTSEKIQQYRDIDREWRRVGGEQAEVRAQLERVLRLTAGMKTVTSMIREGMESDPRQDDPLQCSQWKQVGQVRGRQLWRVLDQLQTLLSVEDTSPRPTIRAASAGD